MIDSDALAKGLLDAIDPKPIADVDVEAIPDSVFYAELERRTFREDPGEPAADPQADPRGALAAQMLNRIDAQTRGGIE